MNRTLGILVSTISLVMSVSACGSSDSTTTNTDSTTPGSTATTTNKKTIARTAVQDSVFKPTDIEATIGKLIEAIGATEAKDQQLTVNLKSVSGYWQPVAIGAQRAMGELKTTGAVAGPMKGDGTQGGVDEQVVMLNDAVAQGTNGIGVAPFEKPVATAMNAAVDAGIPVVTIDSDLADSKRDLYIGTLNADAGKTAGGTLLTFLPKGAGTVIVLGHDDPGWTDGYDRSMAAKGAIEAGGYTAVVYKTSWATDGETTDLAGLANIFATANPPVVGMIGMFSNAYRCAMAAQAAGRTATDIAIVAFDFDPKTVEFMQSGMIKATHAQRQYYMGYLTPYVLYGMNVLGKDKTKSIIAPHMVDQFRFNSGLDVVKSDQLDAYYSFLDSLGVGGS